MDRQSKVYDVFSGSDSNKHWQYKKNVIYV